MSYQAPVQEQAFVVATAMARTDPEAVSAFAMASPELVTAVLAESARLAEMVFAPLNQRGDREGARLVEGKVVLPEGFSQAYQHYADGGWSGLNAMEAVGGQQMPFVLGCAVQEQLTAANMALSLSMMLTLGAIEALSHHGDAQQKQLYLPRLVSGEWAATMNLTESQAGSDVGALRTRAVLQPDGRYHLTGQKIFISWGEHECRPNILHLVLARLPDAPAGTKGISLFLVPKFLVQEDGTLGARNDVRCVGLEHKLGIHASPTCTMVFGEQNQCVGYLVGAPHSGMAAMFTMMNHARVNVGIQGVALAERAYQGALAFAQGRVQGARLGAADRTLVPIIEHLDVRRMLLTVRAYTQGARALVYANAAAVDCAGLDPLWQKRADLLTPLSKAFATDIGVEMTSLALQVFGGMGYIEETGAAQHYRDARVAAIYEGTNGIQALDLVMRKVRGDAGVAMRALLAEMAAMPEIATAVAHAGQATDFLLTQSAEQAAASATPYLRLMGLTIGGFLLAGQAKALADDASPFAVEKRATVRFYLDQILPQTAGLLPAVLASPQQLAAAF